MSVSPNHLFVLPSQQVDEPNPQLRHPSSRPPAALVPGLPPTLTEVELPDALSAWTADPRPDRHREFTAGLAHTAIRWNLSKVPERGMLQAICQSVSTVIPRAVGAAVLLPLAPGHTHLLASSGVLPPAIAALHDAGDEACPGIPGRPRSGGPRRGRVAPGRDHGWPVATTRRAYGVDGSVVCAPLGLGAASFGTLVIAVDQVDEHTEFEVVSVAMHASLAVAAARERDNLQAAVDSRDVIGQAKGILMERLLLTEEAAFQHLADISQSTNTKLRDVCVKLCSTGELFDVTAAPGRSRVRSAPAGESPAPVGRPGRRLTAEEETHR